MNTEQQTEEKKPELPVLITDKLVELKINGELMKQKLNLPDLQKRALEVVKNEDNLKVMADLLADLKKVDDLADDTFTKVKAPYWAAGKACDAGKKLVLDQTARIRGMFKGDYDRLLKAVADKKKAADLKIVTDAAILKGIEDNVITFSNMVIAAIDRKGLTAVESRINLEKSPSMAKKYGEFHQKAIERYDSVLLPIIKDQKVKVEELERLNKQVLEAEANNDPDRMDALNEEIDAKSNEILQNHALIQEAALNQDSFSVVEGTEVLPDFKVKRTNYSIEIADVDVALKKVPGLLEITINKEACKPILESLKKDGAFDGKDEVIVCGIKYIATRVRGTL